MADLVIRGIEMPKEGEKILIAAGGSVWVNAWPTRGYMRKENVYAVPLPEGHGRLIDADSMLRKYVTDAHGLDGIYDTTDLPEMLSYMPSIVPAEGGTDNDGNA